MAPAYNKPDPTWVCGALIELKPIPRPARGSLH
jgi:hypothetical protein